MSTLENISQEFSKNVHYANPVCLEKIHKNCTVVITRSSYAVVLWLELCESCCGLTAIQEVPGFNRAADTAFGHGLRTYCSA